MPLPTLTDAPPAPLRSDAPAVFTSTAEAFVAWQADTFVPEMQDVIDAINALGFSTNSWKPPVRAASTANVTLATGAENGDSLDGVTLATGDRILLKDQSSAADNGIYTVNASGAPTRATDVDEGSELLGAVAFVSEGTANGNKFFFCSTNAPITVGSTAQVWEQLGGSSLSLASTTEVLTGTDSAKAVTPDALAALWEQGSDVASAGTTSLGEGGYFNITGTTTITDIDFATDKAGRRAWLKFAGILTLTNGANLILPTGANITTAAGDTAEFISEGSDVVRCVSYQRASGEALAGGASAPNVQSVTSAATVTPTFSNDAVHITAQAAGLTLANPTGTAVDGWGMSIRIKDNGTLRSITYGSQYRAIGVNLPSSTVAGKTLYLGLVYNADDTKWDVVAVAQEA